MASDSMRLRLHLRETRVLAVALDTPSELRVEVESTVRRPRCPACGFRCVRVHDTRRRKVRDLEVSGRRTTLVWRRRRFVCDNCGSRHLEDHPEFEGRLTRRLVADARVMTLRAAARRHGLSWHLINGVVKAWSAALAVWVPIIRSWALTRGFALHPGTRNRYMMRCTRTQHRSASRQVSDHGRVSGTHRPGIGHVRRVGAENCDAPMFVNSRVG